MVSVGMCLLLSHINSIISGYQVCRVTIGHIKHIRSSCVPFHPKEFDLNTSLLVGAPLDHSHAQPLVYQGGAVYRCRPHGNCSQIPFDTTGANQILLRGRKEATDSKAEQWFGATLHSAGENGAVVACAPRYVYFSSNLRRRDPVGACWVARPSLSAFQEYAPCRNGCMDQSDCSMDKTPPPSIQKKHPYGQDTSFGRYCDQGAWTNLIAPWTRHHH
ncbi:hypothetical protein LAZ67_1002269 [Cordylochernes scorpioides]|uniref:Uncharacterized protein n=1 Tax=Cordylochernes scorpioides TaxID=51811 RepID=A0ABY6JVZ7_9ARAC|nr:hypothetical protein LAZ67_1002269 [Cordylochernes scorpioides]